MGQDVAVTTASGKAKASVPAARNGKRPRGDNGGSRGFGATVHARSGLWRQVDTVAGELAGSKPEDLMRALAANKCIIVRDPRRIADYALLDRQLASA
jgi:hypothetical protein